MFLWKLSNWSLFHINTRYWSLFIYAFLMVIPNMATKFNNFDIFWTFWWNLEHRLHVQPPSRKCYKAPDYNKQVSFCANLNIITTLPLPSLPYCIHCLGLISTVTSAYVLRDECFKILDLAYISDCMLNIVIRDGKYHPKYMFPRRNSNVMVVYQTGQSIAYHCAPRQEMQFYLK